MVRLTGQVERPPGRTGDLAINFALSLSLGVPDVMGYQRFAKP